MKTFDFNFETLKAVFNECYPNGNIFLDCNLNLNVHYTSGGLCRMYKPQADSYMARGIIKTSIQDTHYTPGRVTTYYYNPNRHNEYTALAILLDIITYDEILYRFGTEE